MPAVGDEDIYSWSAHEAAIATNGGTLEEGGFRGKADRGAGDDGNDFLPDDRWIPLMNESIEYGTYLVTQADRSAGGGTIAVVEAAIAGGVDLVQLREKHASARERYDLGRKLRERTAAAGIPLLVNDRVDLAEAIGADGVHLGEEDLPVAVARDLLGDGAIIGRSVSTPAAARTAEAVGADYLGVGAVFRTESKEVLDEQSEIGVERVGKIAESVSIPVIGIGGITVESAREVVAAGADGVAVISAIAGADDPGDATRALGEQVLAGRRAR
jgi:thiamine-phosphate pyrophosphorylase